MVVALRKRLFAESCPTVGESSWQKSMPSAAFTADDNSTHPLRRDGDGPLPGFSRSTIALIAPA